MVSNMVFKIVPQLINELKISIRYLRDLDIQEMHDRFNIQDDKEDE